MLRLAVAILMIFIQCFGSVTMARVVCFRGGAICCITSAWASSQCCERVEVHESNGCKCCGRTQDTCDERSVLKNHTSSSLKLGPQTFDAVLRASDCQPVVVMAILESSKLPEDNVLSHWMIFTSTEFVYGDGLTESTKWSIVPPSPSLTSCRNSIMRC